MFKSYFEQYVKNLQEEQKKNVLLSEGLVTSYPIDMLKQKIGKLPWVSQIHKTSDFIMDIWAKSKNFKDEHMDEIKKLLDLYGYFIVRMEPDDFIPNFSVEAKYPQKLNDVTIPDYLYHITPTKNLPSIKKKGLLPRHTIRKSFNHPGNRLYLLTKNDEVERLSDLMKMGRPENEQEQSLLVIPTSGLETHEFFIDPQYEHGIFTFKGIPPNKIRFPEE
jgi:hypothetical protein